MFYVNPMGAKWDAQMVGDGREINANWDGVWNVSTRITEDGWYAEIAIPLRTFKFGSESPQTWGINFMRRIRRRNEDAFWAPLPRIYRLQRVSLAGTLEGLQNLHPGANLKVKPYALGSGGWTAGSNLVGDRAFGVDAKYGVTTGLTWDFTVNTDFSQVEADEQQVNLTRVQPVLSREARLLPRELRRLPVRSGQRPRHGRTAELGRQRRRALLQPADRVERRGRCHPDRRRDEVDGSRRAVQRRRARHSRERTGDDAARELHDVPGAARHPPEFRRGRHLHEQGRERPTVQSDGRRGHEPAVLPQLQHQFVRRQDVLADVGGEGKRRRRVGSGRVRAIATVSGTCVRSCSRSGSGSTTKWATSRVSASTGRKRNSACTSASSRPSAGFVKSTRTIRSRTSRGPVAASTRATPTTTCRSVFRTGR